MIPNIIHFIWLRGRLDRPWSYINTCCVRAAHAIQKPDKIILWSDRDAPAEIADIVELRPIEKQSLVGVSDLEYAQYRSDLARLFILQQHGGIYLDTDMLLVQPLDDLRGNEFVAGVESDDAICGAALMAKPGARFIQLWLDAFSDGLATGIWAYQCVNTPHEIAIRRPDLITLLPRTTFAPFDFSNNWLFDPATPSIPSDCRGLHVWETFWRDYLGHVTPSYVRESNSLFARMVREVLPDTGKNTGHDEA